VTCYGIGSTAERIKTACGKRIMRASAWTTAAGMVKCPDCRTSDAYKNREGRLGIGDATAQVPEEIAMEPANRGTRFNMTRQQKSLLDVPVKG
jgi:hypothetical protein